ncbi:MAG TPA: hypothetical protein VL948_16155 [Verrucomicrobiae bacterium]|jgi:hypothetical protein|nr:hypothetical protein [Verrucomicrobiae bacterium]
MYSVEATLLVPWVSVMDTFDVIARVQSACTAGRVNGPFVVASLNFEMVASVRGAMMAVLTSVTLFAHSNAS